MRVRIDRRQLLKWPQPLVFRRLVVVDLEQLGQLRPAIPAPCFAVNPHPIAQTKTADNFRRDKNVLRGLDKIAFRIAQESKAFARNFNDAVAKLRLA